MADLFRISIDNVEGTRCSAKLISIHPDQSEIPVVENIAFQIVIEAYEKFGPFDSHPWKEKMDKWLSYTRRQKISISAEEYEDYDSGKLSVPEECSGMGFEGNERYLLKKENNREFVRAANNEISNIELTNSHVIDDLPSGTLLFEAFEVQLFAHLKNGMTWESAMYDRTYFM